MMASMLELRRGFERVEGGSRRGDGLFVGW